MTSKFEFVVEDQAREAERVVERLVAQAKTVQEQMERLQENLAANGVNANINELGELQGRGLELDRLCGEFGVHKIMSKRLQFASQDA